MNAQDAELYKQHEELWSAALERPPWERKAFLAEACANDTEPGMSVVDLLALDYWGAILRYALETSRPLTRSELAELKKPLPKEAGVIMETMASAWIKEGVQKGLQQGRQEAGVELTPQK